MRHLAVQAAAALAFAPPLLAHAGAAVDVEIVDRETGRTLPVYWHEGERHVAKYFAHKGCVHIRQT